MLIPSLVGWMPAPWPSSPEAERLLIARVAERECEGKTSLVPVTSGVLAKALGHPTAVFAEAGTTTGGSRGVDAVEEIAWETFSKRVTVNDFPECSVTTLRAPSCKPQAFAVAAISSRSMYVKDAPTPARLRAYGDALTVGKPTLFLCTRAQSAPPGRIAKDKDLIASWSLVYSNTSAPKKRSSGSVKESFSTSVQSTSNPLIFPR